MQKIHDEQNIKILNKNIVFPFPQAPILFGTGAVLRAQSRPNQTAFLEAGPRQYIFKALR